MPIRRYSNWCRLVFKVKGKPPKQLLETGLEAFIIYHAFDKKPLLYFRYRERIASRYFLLILSRVPSVKIISFFIIFSMKSKFTMVVLLRAGMLQWHYPVCYLVKRIVVHYPVPQKNFHSKTILVENESFLSGLENVFVIIRCPV